MKKTLIKFGLDDVKIKPSDLMDTHPWNSPLQNSECESMACSLLRTMNMNGNKWIQPTYEQYVKYRKSLGPTYDVGGKDQYDKIVCYLKSPDTAALFSNSWRKIINEMTTI